MKDIIEFKSLSGQVKDVDTSGRRITGYLSKFGNIDLDNDVMQRGAFAKSIAERMESIFFLNQHMWSQPLSKFRVLKEDDYGLYFESESISKTSYGNDVVQLYADGLIKEHSIGFRTLQYDFDTNRNVRIIKEVKLFEGSAVTLGANSDTPFLGFKSMTLDEVNDQSKTIYNAIRNGKFTDETFSLLEIALKQLQYQAYELGKKSLENQEPGNPTRNESEPIADTIKQFINSLN